MNSQSIPYGIHIENKVGIHSIDKLIIDYELKYSKSIDDFLSLFSSRSGFVYCSDSSSESYNSFFDKPACSHYSWFRSSFWFPHCNVKLGKYSRSLINDSSDSDIKKKNVFDLIQIIRLEFNPNYLYEDSTFLYLQQVICGLCQVGFLVECDYSVDILCSPKDVICKSRADKIVYNDSRYYGKRHKNGRIKIYNKKREFLDRYKIDIGDLTTRCEVTLRGNESPCFDSVSLFSGFRSLDLSANLLSIGKLIELASSYGEDREELLNLYVPDKRNRDKLIPFLFGSDSDFVFNADIFYQLIDRYAIEYYFWCCFFGDAGKILYSPFSSVKV